MPELAIYIGKGIPGQYEFGEPCEIHSKDEITSLIVGKDIYNCRFNKKSWHRDQLWWVTEDELKRF